MTDKYRLTEEDQSLILSEQVLLAYRQLPVASYHNCQLYPGCAGCVGYLWHSINELPHNLEQSHRYLWICSPGCSKKIHVVNIDHSQARNFAWFHITTTTVSGIVWGTIAFALPMLSAQQQVIILIILAGLVSGATVSSAALTGSYLGFILPVVLFSNIAVINIGGSFGYIISLAFFIYAIFLISAGRRIHQTLLSNVKMRLQQQALNKQLTNEQQRFEQVLNASPAGTLLINASGRIEYSNTELCRLFGYTHEELKGQAVELLVPEKYRQQHGKVREQFIEDDKTRRMGIGMKLYGQHKDGAIFPVEIGLQPITLVNKKLQVVTLMDLSEQVKLQEIIQQQADQLEQASLTDELTQVGNRRAFNNKIIEHVALSLRCNIPVSLMMLDIDHFKEYNDSFGHVEGDKALNQVATILNHESRKSDFVARYGGEEFIIILPDTNREKALHLAERIRTAIDNYSWPFRPLTISIGVSTTPELIGKAIQTDKVIDSLIRLADEALYQSKSSGRNKVSVI